MMNSLLFELCAENIEAAKAAERGGAGRIELCSDLACGGLTPDLELMLATVGAVTIPVHVLIRPRAGDFVYSPNEMEVMRGQIDDAKFAGAAGVALGALRRDGRVDIEGTRELIKHARPMDVTFHRAFDETADLAAALEDVIETGADSLLTSGGAPDVQRGAETIAALARQAKGRIRIIAGGGLRLASVTDVMRHSGIFCLHGSLVRDRKTSTPLKLEQDVREAVRLLQAEFAGSRQRALAT